MSSSLNIPASFVARCGECRKKLRVSDLGCVVECPHCQTPLEVPEDPRSLSDLPTLQSATLGDADSSPTMVLEDDWQPRVGNSKPLSTVDDTVDESLRLSDGPDFGAADTDESFLVQENPPAREEVPNGEEGEVDENAETVEFQVPTVGTLGDSLTGEKPRNKRGRSKRSARAKAKTDGDGDTAETVPKLHFHLALAAASVLSLICLALLWSLATVRTHQLESLPDVVPPVDENGQVSRTIANPRQELAPGHRLRLNETVQFGDLLVTPLRVVRDRVTLVHRTTGEERVADAGSVWKLELRLENAGDTPFAPLDEELLFYRRIDPQRDFRTLSNAFIKKGDHQGDWDNLAYVYDHVVTGDWDLKGQRLATPLEPGESITTYVPSQPKVPGPLTEAEELVWRLQIRKGVSPAGYGVTTLIEVVFEPEQIRTT